MKTNALLKLHQRQVDVLDMIIKANNNKEEMEKDGRIYRSKSDSFYYPIADNRFESAKRFERIKQRLIQYYSDIQERILKLQPIVLSDSESDLLIQQYLS